MTSNNNNTARHDMQFLAELTDTIGGQANYCWARRATFEAPADASTRLLVRRAKKALSLTNSRHSVAWDCGDMIRLNFNNSATCLFISPLTN